MLDGRNYRRPVRGHPGPKLPPGVLTQRPQTDISHAGQESLLEVNTVQHKNASLHRQDAQTLLSTAWRRKEPWPLTVTWGPFVLTCG